MNRKNSEFAPSTVAGHHESTLVRAHRLIQQRHYAQALDLVHASSPDPALKNAKGVCLLRLGKYEAAVPVFREMVFKQGCVWVRPEVPTVYKINFATALLLSGKIEGGLNVLGQALDEKHPGVLRLRQSIRRWKQSFTLWQRVTWLLGGMDDPKQPLILDFEPGLLEDGIVTERIDPNAIPAPERRPAA